MAYDDRMKKWAALPVVEASESHRVGHRAQVPAFVFLAALLVATAFGCHRSAPESAPSDRQSAPAVSSDRDAIEAVVRGYLKAENERDLKGAEGFLTAKARAFYTEHTRLREGAPRMLGATYQLGEPAITGDTADIAVTYREAGQERKNALKLRRVDGKWGIFAYVNRLDPDDPDSEIIMNLEDPEATSNQYFSKLVGATPKEFEEDFKKGHDRQIQELVEGKPGPDDLAVEALESISREQFEASWKLDIHSEGRPAGEVLSDLAKMIGRTLETTPIQDRALARPLAIDVRGLSRLQAIDGVARAGGLSPVYPDPEWNSDSSGQHLESATLRLRPRRGPSSIAFRGPFQVEADLSEAAPHATAILTVKATASGLPPFCLNDLGRAHGDAFIVTDVLDAKGRSLVDTEAAASIRKFWVTPPPGEYAQFTRVPLKGLLRDVSAIKTLRCKLSIPLPTRVETVRFDRLVPGETRTVGDLDLTLQTADKRQQRVDDTPVEHQVLSIVVHRNNLDRAKPLEPDKKERPVPEGIGKDRVKFVGHDAQGWPLKTSSSGAISSDSSGSWTPKISIHGPATSLVAKVIMGWDTLVYEFVLEDIPLASRASMPERIEPAAFPGKDSPVTVEVLPIGGNAGSENMTARASQPIVRQPIGPGPQPAARQADVGAAETEKMAQRPGTSGMPGQFGGMGILNAKPSASRFHSPSAVLRLRRQ